MDRTHGIHDRVLAGILSGIYAKQPEHGMVVGASQMKRRSEQEGLALDVTTP
jgi:hypothetical protein